MTTHPAANVHPYTLRLFLDVDPAGNPIGFGCVSYERGTEGQTLYWGTPGPFDTMAEALADLLTDHVNYIGSQLALF